MDSEALDPKRLAFSGKVSIDDDNVVLVGDDPVLAKIEGNFRSDLVEVYLGAERQAAVTVAGEVEADSGFEGSDITPAEPPRIEVGNFDLLGKLNELEGHHVELVIREVERPPSFVIEVDPRLPEGKWITPNPRFSGQNRGSSELTGDKLVELVDTKASPIIVSFSMHSRVKTAIDEYQAIERNTRRVLPLIEVVPGKGEGAVQRKVELRGSFQLTDQEEGKQTFGIGGLTEVEWRAANRALNGFKDGKLIALVDPDDIDIGLTDQHTAFKAHTNLMANAVDAAKFAEALKPFSVPCQEHSVAGEPAAVVYDEHEATKTIATLYESEDLSVYVDSSYALAHWRLGEGISPGSRRVGGFTDAAVQKALDEHYKKLTVSEDLRPNAEAFLASRELASLRRTVDEKRTASEQIVESIRSVGKTVDELARKASAEAKEPSAILWGGASTRELNMARDRLTEALGWAERHKERAEANQDQKPKGGFVGGSLHFAPASTFISREDDAPHQ